MTQATPRVGDVDFSKPCLRPGCNGYAKCAAGEHGLFWGCTKYRYDRTGCNYWRPLDGTLTPSQPASFKTLMEPNPSDPARPTSRYDYVVWIAAIVFLAFVGVLVIAAFLGSGAY